MSYFLVSLVIVVVAVFIAQRADVEGMNTRQSTLKAARPVNRRQDERSRGVSLAQFAQQ